MWSLCDNSNPNRQPQEAAYGKVTAGIFGYSHAFGGHAGSHAEYVRVPYADHNAFKVLQDIPDEQAVFVSDAAPTGFYAAELCGIRPGDVAAVWGCGGVGQMAIRSAYLLGVERVIAIDRFPDRLAKARERAGAETLNYEETSVLEALDDMTGGRGPDACIDAVGMEADAIGIEDVYDRTKQYLRLQSDRPHVLRQAFLACRKGGAVSIIGVYGGLIDKFPIGVAMNKGLTLRMGQQPGQNYVERLFGHIRRSELASSHLLTHRLPLDDGPRIRDVQEQRGPLSARRLCPVSAGRDPARTEAMDGLSDATVVITGASTRSRSGRGRQRRSPPPMPPASSDCI